MAKSLRQLTESYERMVRTQRQNSDKIASGEWNDDDVFAEAFRQACVYKGRATVDVRAAPALGSQEMIASYLVAPGVPVLDLDTTVRSFLVEDVDEGVPEATRAEIDSNPEALPRRLYDIYASRHGDGSIATLTFDLRWKAHDLEDFDATQAREYLDRLPGLLEFADRMAAHDPAKYGQSRPHFEAHADYLRTKFGIAA